MEKKYVNITLIAEKSIDDLDWIFANEVGINLLSEEELVLIKEGNHANNAHVINIDMMIDELQSLKNQGATHIAIDYHGDHIGYDIAGFLVRKSSNEEIRDFEKKRN